MLVIVMAMVMILMIVMIVMIVTLMVRVARVVVVARVGSPAAGGKEGRGQGRKERGASELRHGVSPGEWSRVTFSSDIWVSTSSRCRLASASV